MDIRTRCEIFSNLTINLPENINKHSVFYIDFEQVFAMIHKLNWLLT